VPVPIAEELQDREVGLTREESDGSLEYLLVHARQPSRDACDAAETLRVVEFGGHKLSAGILTGDYCPLETHRGQEPGFRRLHLPDISARAIQEQIVYVDPSKQG